MATDIIERLRWWGAKRKSPKGMPILSPDCAEAADHIESQALRIAELEKLAYAETSAGPMLWKDIWQREVDQMEWYRSSLNPVWDEVRVSERAVALEAAAKALESPERAADAYVAENGIEHSGGIIESAFEAGARWAALQVVKVRWRVFEDITRGWFGIEEDIFDGNTILYPKRINREPLDGIVRAHNAALVPSTPAEHVVGSEDEDFSPYEQALRAAVEPFLDWLEMREEGARIKEVREGLIGVEDVLPDDHVALGAHPRAHKDDGVITIGHFRKLLDAYEARALIPEKKEG